MTIAVELPDDLAEQMASPGRNLARTALEGMALEAYRARQLSAAQLRRLLGFETRYELDGFLKEREVWIDYSDAEWEREQEAAERLWRKRQDELAQSGRQLGDKA